MKRLIFLTAIILLLINLNISSQSRGVTLAGRFVKLANSYIHLQDFNLAISFLKKAQSELKGQNNWESNYWLAAIDESFGLLYMKMGIADDAKLHFERAKSRYSQLISMDKGSSDAIRQLLNKIDDMIISINGNIHNQFNSPTSDAIKGSNVLNFDNQKLRDLPSNIPTNAENISLANNNLRDFPHSLSNFNNLKYLNLSHNRIVNWNFISGLNNLTYLDLSGNRIKQLPSGLSNLTKLEVLDLSDNRLRDLPIELNNMNNLRVLNIMGNRIPFSKIKNLLQSNPNTNILHDEYLQIDYEAEEEF